LQEWEEASRTQDEREKKCHELSISERRTIKNSGEECEEEKRTLTSDESVQLPKFRGKEKEFQVWWIKF
jgi:hypothetical protein